MLDYTLQIHPAATNSSELPVYMIARRQVRYRSSMLVRLSPTCHHSRSMFESEYLHWCHRIPCMFPIRCHATNSNEEGSRSAMTAVRHRHNLKDWWHHPQ